ncbi:MarR family winged helix-turn-helix transcriptional regulator [Deinococcus apachensis]|uniref:MarR family winged helix-turn-helix transcriptional regulator n=1 Tax=Deinococcus apachensis TaxID=309886 RepID=UPI0003756E63|nr:MarR family transcriptional regulator [Deinococcus apachensis]
MSRRKREELVGRFFEEISRNSTWTVIFHQAQAARLGLNPTDLKAAGLLRDTGPVTAGELAELMALTTGAVTGVIDRLERSGLVERVKDPADRRRVVVRTTEDPERMKTLEALFASLGGATGRLLERFSDEQLETILEFVVAGTQLMKEQTARLREEASVG